MQRHRRTPWVNTGLALILVVGLFVADRLGLFPTKGEAPSRGAETQGSFAPRSADTHARLSAVTGDQIIEDAFRRQASGVLVEASAEISKLLADDRDGHRHQRFILRLDSGRTLLCAHNIDLAPRVPAKEGDRIEFSGQYEWNEQGGVLHWTHHDPDGRHPGGWIRHAGKLYE